MLEDLIIWTNYEIEVAAYNSAGLGVYSSKVTEWTLQGGGWRQGPWKTRCVLFCRPLGLLGHNALWVIHMFSYEHPSPHCWFHLGLRNGA